MTALRLINKYSLILFNYEDKRIELNVDIIGSQPSTLTKDEERAISDYIRSHKAKMSHKIIKDKVTI